MSQLWADASSWVFNRIRIKEEIIKDTPSQFLSVAKPLDHENKEESRIRAHNYLQHFLHRHKLHKHQGPYKKKKEEKTERTNSLNVLRDH